MLNQTARSEARSIKKKNIFLDYFSNLKSIVTMGEEKKENEVFETLKDAHREWEKAQLYFQSVTEPDLIDHAIYNMEAAKTKYYYLLKNARRAKGNLDD